MTLRDKISSDKKNLLRSFFKLAAVQTTFLIFAILITGGGHGAYVQFPIFYSWLFLPISMNYYTSPVAGFYWLKFLPIYLLFIPVVLFLLYFVLFLAVQSKKIGRKSMLIIIILHMIGALLNIIFERGFPWHSPSDHLVVLALSVILTSYILFFFWRIFFQAIGDKING